MSLAEITLLLFLVVDPFGNLPFVIALLRNLPTARYLKSVGREALLAFLILAAFALGGDAVLRQLHIDAASLSIAGGIILFLISLGMIFRSATRLFDDDYADDPLLVPIAVPSIAGPSAITAVIILRSREQVPLESVLVALAAVFVATLIVFAAGRPLSRRLGQRGVTALEKFMGLLLNLVAVNMILTGVRDFAATL